MDIKTELKPCPLCGSEAQLEKSPMYGLVAVTCGCSSHVFFGAEFDEEETIEAWNTRHHETCTMIKESCEDNYLTEKLKESFFKCWGINEGNEQ